ncbi:unnamed protein product [Adineta steineri]|uniref:Uncharacterized protein n=1 Tax=Adineta steineri TaxID=433720 RepID=A0A815N3D0_9BILA|nr:unnamed protein product [Adineta steineri]CAF3988590.1 unnamed protein product [Adineta steineri]
MIASLGHCEDLECARSPSNQVLVRLFRCSIHCDRLLCLNHLNKHNVYYEEQKKENEAVRNELESSLALYHALFEQHLTLYRDLVRQASALIFQNTTALVPIEQIRPVLENIQKAIAFFQQERVIIKSESPLDSTGYDIDKVGLSLGKDFPLIKKEQDTPVKLRPILRIERVDLNKEILCDHILHDENKNRNQKHHDSTHRSLIEESLGKSKDSTDNITIDSISSIADEDTSMISKLRKSTEENHQSHTSSPGGLKKKKSDGVKKKSEKTVTVKRLQT